MRPVPCFLFLCTSAGALGWYAGAPPHSDQPPPRTEAAASGVAQIVRPATPAVKISTLSAAAVKARLEAVLASPARDSVELRLLLAQWVATDLEAARQWMREIPDDLHDRQSRAAVMEFFKAWTRLDPDAALEEAKTLRLLKRNESLSSIVPTLAEADLATIHRVLGKLPPDSPGPFNSIGITDLVRRLAACDPAGAQTIPALLSPVRAAAAVSVLAEVMARSDPQAALAWVQQQPDATARKAAEDAVFKEWARRDPAAVGPLLLQKTEGRPDVFRADAAVAALRRLSDGSAAEATAFVEKFIPPDQVNAHLRSFFDVLGKNPESPGGAAALCACVAKLSPEALKEAKLFPSSWLVYEGMKPAWDRMMAEPDSPARTFLLGQMGQKLMDQRPAEVIQEVMKLPDPAGREELLAAVFSGRRGFDGTGTDDYRGGLTELRAVVESLPEGLRDQGAMRLAWATAGDDPRGAAEIVQQYPAIAGDEHFIRNLAMRFMDKSDASGALRWADALPTDASRASAYGNVATAWFVHDSKAASQWVNGLPPGPDRDAAAASIASNSTRYDEPEGAFAWAASVQDPALRARATGDVIGIWARYDPQMTSEAVAASALPESEKAALLRILNQNR